MRKKIIFAVVSAVFFIAVALYGPFVYAQQIPDQVRYVQVEAYLKSIAEKDAKLALQLTAQMLASGISTKHDYIAMDIATNKPIEVPGNPNALVISRSKEQKVEVVEIKDAKPLPPKPVPDGQVPPQAPPAAPVLVNPKVPTPLGVIQPYVNKSGKIIEGKYVIKYCPNPARPSECVTSDIITEKTEGFPVDDENWLKGKTILKYYFDQNEERLVLPKDSTKTYVRNKKGDLYEIIETSTYIPDGQGGVKLGEATNEVIKINDEAGLFPKEGLPSGDKAPRSPVTKSVDTPMPKYEAPSEAAKSFMGRINGFFDPKPPAETPKRDPSLPPGGRQPRKPKAENPATPPVGIEVKDATEDVPGVSATPVPKSVALKDPDSWIPAPMTLSSKEIEAGYKAEGFSSKPLKDAAGKTTGYEVGVSFCPDGALACGPIKKATGATFEDAKSKAMAAAKTAYDVQFPTSKNQFIMPGSMKK